MSSPDSKQINLVRCIKCGKILMCSRYDTATLLEHVRLDHPEVDIIDTETKQKRSTGVPLKEFSPKLYSNSKGNGISPQSEQEDKIENCDEDEVVGDEYEDGNEGEQLPRHPKYVKEIDLTRYSVVSEVLERYPEIKECEYAPRNPNAQVLYTRRYRVTTPSPVSSSVLKEPFHRSLYYTSIEKWRPVTGRIFCPKCGCNKRPLIKTKTERFTYNKWVASCIFSCWPCCFLPWALPAQNNEYLYCANCKILLGLYDHNRNCVIPNRLHVSKKSNQQSSKVAKRNRDAVEESKLLENESPPSQSYPVNNAKAKRLPTIIVDGRELPPETVARIQKLKRYGSLVGIDMGALTNPSDAPKSTPRSSSHKDNEHPAPSMAKENRQSVRDSV